jgi:hypothetical protein
MQSLLSQRLYERHGFQLDVSLFGPRGKARWLTSGHF